MKMDPTEREREIQSICYLKLRSCCFVVVDKILVIVFFKCDLAL
jgi:hypothetical protein